MDDVFLLKQIIFYRTHFIYLNSHFAASMRTTLFVCTRMFAGPVHLELAGTSSTLYRIINSIVYANNIFKDIVEL